MIYYESYYGSYYDDGLMHHGRKGQKWGVRNGPPYPLKRSVASRAYGKIKRAGKLAGVMLRAAADSHKKRHEIRMANAAARRRERILRDPGALYKHRNEFTDEELAKAINRISLEQRLADLRTDKVNRGRKYADAFINYLGSAGLLAKHVSSISDSVTKVVKNAAELSNSNRYNLEDSNKDKGFFPKSKSTTSDSGNKYTFGDSNTDKSKVETPKAETPKAETPKAKSDEKPKVETSNAKSDLFGASKYYQKDEGRPRSLSEVAAMYERDRSVKEKHKAIESYRMRSQHRDDEERARALVAKSNNVPLSEVASVYEQERKDKELSKLFRRTTKFNWPD